MLFRSIDKGSNLTFSGFPVKVKGKPLVMAKSVQAGDQMVQINRQPTAMGGAQSSGSTDKGQGTQTQGAGGSEDSGKTDQPNRP